MGDASGSKMRIIFGFRFDADTILAASALTFQWIDSPGDTSAHTYSLKWKGNTSYSKYLGRSYDDTDNLNYGRTPNQIVAMEILA